MKAWFVVVVVLFCSIILPGCESRSLHEKAVSDVSSEVASAPHTTGRDRKTPEIRKPEQHDKIAFFKEMLANHESIEKDDRYVYTSNGTERIGLVEQFIWNIEENEQGRLTGYLAGATVPMVYEFTYEPNGEVLFILYGDYLGLKEYVVTDIYEHPLFYHFTDNKEVYFSIPKTDFVFSPKTPIEGYVAGSDLKSGGPASTTFTAQQAINIAMETDAALDAYFDSGGDYCGHGMIVPETIADDAALSKYGKIADAVFIQDARYYKVAIFQNQAHINIDDIYAVPVSVYYVSADDSIVFCESMVAGELVPIGCKEARHLQPSG